MMKQCVLWILCIALLLSGAAAEEARTGCAVAGAGIDLSPGTTRAWEGRFRRALTACCLFWAARPIRTLARVYAALLNEEDQSAIAEITAIDGAAGLSGGERIS